MYIQKTTDSQNKAHAIRVKLLNPANQIPQGDIAILQKRLRLSQDANESLKREIAKRDAEIALLRLDLADRNARVLAQAQKICQLHDEDEIGEMHERKSVKDICLEVLADYPGVTMQDIISVHRSKSLVEPRRRCHYEVYKQRPDLSSVKIGRFMRRDHSSILHSIEKYEEILNAGAE